MSQADWARKLTYDAAFANCPPHQREEFMARMKQEQTEMDTRNPNSVEADDKQDDKSSFLIQAPDLDNKEGVTRKSEASSDRPYKIRFRSSIDARSFIDLILKQVDASAVTSSDSDPIVWVDKNSIEYSDMRYLATKFGGVKISEDTIDYTTVNSMNQLVIGARVTPSLNSSEGLVKGNTYTIVDVIPAGVDGVDYVFQDQFGNRFDVTGTPELHQMLIPYAAPVEQSIKQSIAAGYRKGIRKVREGLSDQSINRLKMLASKYSGKIDSIDPNKLVFKFPDTEAADDFFDATKKLPDSDLTNSVVATDDKVVFSESFTGGMLAMYAPQSLGLVAPSNYASDKEMPPFSAITSSATNDGHTHLAYYDDAGNGYTSEEEGHKHQVRSFQVVDVLGHQHPGLLPMQSFTDRSDNDLDYTGQVL